MAGKALSTYLAMEAVGSPIEAAELGRPANGTDVLPPGSTDAEGYPRDVMEQHARLVQWFEDAERTSQDERQAAERDRDYYDGKQWTEAELAALRKRGQPDLTINYVRRKVDLLSGLERKGRTDPKAYPRTPAEEDRADAATQALRFLSDDWAFPAKRSEVYLNMLVEGFGGAELGLEDDGKGGANLTLTPVPWDRLFRDPHARALDFSDARYLGMVVWMDKDQLRELYPDADDVISESFAPQSGTFADRPGQISWNDNRRERSRVVQIYWLEGGVWWGATITRAGYLAEPVRSPFKDRRGRPACPLILQSAYVDRDNRRYGAVRDLISLQDEINKRRSKALHLLTTRQVIAEKGAVDNVEKARQQVAKPDGYIEINPQMRFEIAQNADLTAGQFNLLQHATQEMQASGPNASMAGNDPRDLSGRAIMAQQAGGAAQNEPLADALRSWTRRVYEVAWMAVREFWRGERWLRVTDDLGKLQWVGLNRVVTLKDRLAEMSEDQRKWAMQEMQLRPDDPRLNTPVGKENDISDLEVDITIEEGNDVPALQAEQFQMLAQLAGSLPPGTIPPDVLIAASSLKDKGQLLERLKEAQQQQAQAQQAAAPLMQAKEQADIGVKQSQAQLNLARAADVQGGAIKRVHDIHRSAAESPAIPEVGPPMLPQPPQGGMP